MSLKTFHGLHCLIKCPTYIQLQNHDWISRVVHSSMIWQWIKIGCTFGLFLTAPPFIFFFANNFLTFAKALIGKESLNHQKLFIIFFMFVKLLGALQNLNYLILINISDYSKRYVFCNFYTSVGHGILFTCIQQVRCGAFSV